MSEGLGTQVPFPYTTDTATPTDLVPDAIQTYENKNTISISYL